MPLLNGWMKFSKLPRSKNGFQTHGFGTIIWVLLAFKSRSSCLFSFFFTNLRSLHLASLIFYIFWVQQSKIAHFVNATTSKIEIFDFSKGCFWIGFWILLGGSLWDPPLWLQLGRKIVPQTGPTKVERKAGPPHGSSAVFLETSQISPGADFKNHFPNSLIRCQSPYQKWKALPPKCKTEV